MITEKEFDAEVKKYENMTPEELDQLSKDWETFQTKSLLCIYRDEVPKRYGYMDTYKTCSAGSMSGHCAFSGCPKVNEVLKLGGK